MGNIFNMDNGFFTTLGKIVDIVLLSIVWFILCIPIITIGPATTALYYTTVKVIRRERGYLMREFFRSFKTNFKMGSLAGILIIAVFLVLYFDRNFALTLEGTKGFVLLSVFNAMIVLLFIVTIYIFPILSRFKMKFLHLFKTSLFMSIKHLPTTIVLVVIVLIFGVGTYILPIVFLISPALCVLVCSLLLERVFKKYMPEKSDETETGGVDEWYLE
jgi:uncharacterized membrane protein YesL